MLPPVFELFVAFVKHRGSSEAERQKRVLELCDLLRPSPPLLRAFYGLLPHWVFVK